MAQFSELKRGTPYHPDGVLAIQIFGHQYAFTREEVLQLRRWCNDALLSHHHVESELASFPPDHNFQQTSDSPECNLCGRAEEAECHS